MITYNLTIFDSQDFLSNLFTALIPIVLFAVGIWYELHQFKKRIKSEHQSQLKYLLQLVEKSKKHIYEVKSSIEIFSTQVNQNPFDILLPSIKVDESLNRLCTHDNKPFFNAVSALSPELTDDLFKLYNSLDFFNLRIKQIFDQNEKHIHNQHKDQWYIKKKLDRVSYYLHDIIEYSLNHSFSNEVFEILMDFYLKFNVSVSKGTEVNQRNFYYYHSITKEAFEKLSSLLESNVSHCSLDTLNLFSQFRNINNRFDHIAFNSSQFAIGISLHDSFDEPMKVIENSIVTIKIISI